MLTLKYIEVDRGLHQVMYRYVEECRYNKNEITPNYWTSESSGSSFSKIVFTNILLNKI